MVFVAECGINHNGDINTALRLIKMAKDAGAELVKFQKRNVDLCVPARMENTERYTPWGKMTYMDYKRKMEFNKAEYDRIDKYCRQLGIRWFVSVWDCDSVNFILQYDVPYIKVPSACITDTHLLLKVKQSGLPIIMSTGMSTFEEVCNAVAILDKDDLSILYCKSAYPTKDDELNLRSIRQLKRIFPQYRIGYSGHETGFGPTILAKALGAEVIERHITLDRTMWGTDHPISLEPFELTTLIDILSKVDLWMGRELIETSPSELLAKQKLRR